MRNFKMYFILLILLSVHPVFATLDPHWDHTPDHLVTNASALQSYLISSANRNNIMAEVDIENLGINGYVVVQRCYSSSEEKYIFVINRFDGNSWGDTIDLSAYKPEIDDSLFWWGVDKEAYNYDLLNDSDNNAHLLFCPADSRIHYYYLPFIDDDWCFVGQYIVDYSPVYYMQSMSCSINESDELYVSYQVHESIYNKGRIGYIYADAYDGSISPTWSSFNTITYLSQTGPIYHEIDTYKDNVINCCWLCPSPTDNYTVQRSCVGYYYNGTLYDSYTLSPTILPSPDTGWQLRRAQDIDACIYADIESGITEHQKSNNQYFVLFKSYDKFVRHLYPHIYLFDSVSFPKIKYAFSDVPGISDGLGYRAHMDIDSNGNLHIVVIDLNYTSGNHYIYYQIYDHSTGTFDDSELVYEPVNNHNAADVNIFVDSDDVPHIVYNTFNHSSGESNSYHICRDEDKSTSFVLSSNVSLLPSNAINVTIQEPYPNPTYDRLNFEVSSNGSDKLSVVFYDISGRRINTYTYNISAGTNMISVPTESLTPGVYLYDLYSKSVSKSGRFVVK